MANVNLTNACLTTLNSLDLVLKNWEYFKMKKYQKIRVSDRNLFYVTTFERSTQMTILGLLYHPNG